MANMRTGEFGTYYGSYYTESESLSLSEMNLNALYIATFLNSKGWTNNAISGILGNMQAESSLNPGRWQSENVGNMSGGYGLVQWTPASKYMDWCTEQGLSDPSEMDNNLKRIIYELENNIQWIPTDEYPLSFKDFSISNKNPSYLASAFLKCYERAGVEVESTRQVNAESWYSVITGYDFDNPPTGGSGGSTTTSKKKKKYNFILFNRKRRVF